MLREDQLENRGSKILEAARRVVVKVGTSTVTGSNGELCTDRVRPIAASIARLIQAGRQITLVSSGAVGLGRGHLGLHRSRLNDLVTKQACAAVGQSLLMNAYKNLFAPWGIKIAQVLLTEDDFVNRRRYSNLRHTIERLLAFGVLPIVNQNDTVSTTEIEALNGAPRTSAFSDNDHLAALVMSGLEADALVFLTNVEGLYQTALAPQAGHSQILPIVAQITPEIRSLASGPSDGGRGGMITKLQATEIAVNCGGIAVIANGRTDRILDRLFGGEVVGTVFLPSKRIRGKRRWIAFIAEVRGRVVVDDGAKRAIAQAKGSLLASGIVEIAAPFEPLDVVSIADTAGREFARGIAESASTETSKFLQKENLPVVRRAARSSSKIVVRRDNIVVLPNT